MFFVTRVPSLSLVLFLAVFFRKLYHAETISNSGQYLITNNVQIILLNLKINKTHVKKQKKV